jgi:hypothetical protein
MYQPGIPTGLVNLDVDYQNLQDNFQQLDTTYGEDHYAYSDPSANNGFHNKITTPGYSLGSPPVTTTDPILYGFQQYAALGLLQYSRGPNNAVPTPLTHLNSSATGLTFTPAQSISVLDLTGVASAMITAYAFGDGGATPTMTVSQVFWNGSSFKITNIIAGAFFIWTAVGNILTLKNQIIIPPNITNAYWTLDLIRIQ